MGRRQAWLLVLLVVVAAAGVVVWAQRPRPCDHVILYRLDQVDERFGLPRDEVLDALRQAAAIWNRAAGHSLFVHSSTGTLPVRLVYDERQQTAQARARLRQSLREGRASYDAAGRSFVAARERYEARALAYREAHAAYEERVHAYNARIEQRNDRGGRSPAAQAELDAEGAQLAALRQQLESERSLLDELATEVKALAARGNVEAEAHNRTVATYNERYGGPRQFEKGDFDGREIAIFEFQDVTDLTLLLAHELGHALGLGHLDDPAAVMHAMQSGQALEPLALSPADLAALHALCG